MSNEVLQLAYEAGRAALREQDATLSNLRTRATGLLAAAALGTSFAAGVGLYKTEPGAARLPVWGAWSLLAETLLVGACVIYVCAPIKDWKYGVDSTGLLQIADRAIDEVYRLAVDAMSTASAENDLSLKGRFQVYRIAIGGLTIQVATLILAALFV